MRAHDFPTADAATRFLVLRDRAGHSVRMAMPVGWAALVQCVANLAPALQPNGAKPEAWALDVLRAARWDLGDDDRPLLLRIDVPTGEVLVVALRRDSIPLGAADVFHLPHAEGRHGHATAALLLRRYGSDVGEIVPVEGEIDTAPGFAVLDAHGEAHLFRSRKLAKEGVAAWHLPADADPFPTSGAD